MIPEQLFDALSALREKYRQQMNTAAEKAQQFAATDEMDRVSEFSSESERKREAFSALNQVIRIVDAAFAPRPSRSTREGENG